MKPPVPLQRRADPVAGAGMGECEDFLVGWHYGEDAAVSVAGEGAGRVTVSCDEEAPLFSFLC